MNTPPLPEGLEPIREGVGGSLSETVIEPFTSTVPPLPAGLVASDPTLGEKAEQIAIGTAEGGVRGTTFLGGGLLGGKYGAAAGGVLAGPPGAVVGGTLGFFGGLTAGFLASEELGDLFPGVPREDLAPYREGAKTFGESMSMYPVAFGIPKSTANRVARFISAMGESARARPVATGVATTLSSTGAGLFGGMSEAYAPGSPGIRMAAEITGAVVFPSPLVLATNAAGTGYDFAKNIIGQFSANTREARAGTLLRNALEEAGEDVDEIVRKLSQPTPLDPRTRTAIQPTAGQKTGVPVLNAIEKTLANAHAKYGGLNKEQGEKAFQAYQLVIERLKDIGDPQSLRKAGELEAQYFDQQLQSRIDLAELEAAQTISRISKDTPAARQQIGQIIRGNVDEALKQARAVEKELWNNAYKASFKTNAAGEVVPRQVRPNNIVMSYVDRVSQINPAFVNDLVPASVQKAMQNLGVTDKVIQQYRLGRRTQEFLESGSVPTEFMPKGIKPVEVSDLVDLRSNLLELARKSSSQGDNSAASLFGNLAEESLEALSRVDNKAYDKARMFSRSLNDTFTRSFAGDMQRTAPSGAERMPVEILVSRAFTSNADLTAMRMQEIEEAVGFMEKAQRDMATQFPRSPEAAALQDLIPFTREQVASTTEAQARALRLIAANYVDPTTGRLNAPALARWATQNKATLDRLGISQDLNDATVAENTLKLLGDPNSAASKAIRNQQAFARLLDFENGSMAVADALRSNFPLKSMNNLVKIAQKGGPEAVAGLKSSVYDYAFNAATNRNGVMSPTVLDQIFFKPLAQNQPSVAKVLRSQGLMSLSEEKNLRRLINPMKRVEEAMKSGSRESMEEVIGVTSPLTDIALRVLGSGVASRLDPTSAQGNSLIVASAGSRFTRKIFDQIPKMSLTRMIEDATQDPKLMAMLLQKAPPISGQQRGLARNLHGYLFAAGYNRAAYEEPTEEVSATPTTGMPAAQLLRQLPPAPQTTGVPGLTSAPRVTPQGPGPRAGPVAPPAPPMPGQPQQPNSRQMLQSLFPFDTTLRAGSPLQ
jgi:hypothetical protein